MNRHWWVCPKNCITDFISSISTQFSHHLVPLKCNKSAIKRAQFRGFGRDRASKILAIFTTASNRSRPRAVHTNTHQPNVTQPALIYVPKVVKMDHKTGDKVYALCTAYCGSALIIPRPTAQVDCTFCSQTILQKTTTKKKTLNLFLSQLCATDPRDPDPCLTSHDLSHMFACAYRSFFSCSYKFPLCKKKKKST